MATVLLDKQGVLAEMAQNAAVASLGGLIEDAKFDRGELTVTVAPEHIRGAAKAVQTAGYNFLEDVTAVDWLPAEPRYQVTYHIVSHTLKERVRLRIFVDSIVGGADQFGPRLIFMSARSSTCLASAFTVTRICAAS
jgi:NADH-quinone oxidoreductase subunit C